MILSLRRPVCRSSISRNLRNKTRQELHGSERVPGAGCWREVPGGPGSRHLTSRDEPHYEPREPLGLQVNRWAHDSTGAPTLRTGAVPRTTGAEGL